MFTVICCMFGGIGFGYYSLSSIFITEYKGTELGTIALLSNIVREMITLLLSPLLVKVAGPLAPIAAGGVLECRFHTPALSEFAHASSPEIPSYGQRNDDFAGSCEKGRIKMVILGRVHPRA